MKKIQILSRDGKFYQTEDRQIYTWAEIVRDTSLSDMVFFYIVDGKHYDMEIKNGSLNYSDYKDTLALLTTF